MFELDDVVQQMVKNRLSEDDVQQGFLLVNFSLYVYLLFFNA